MSFLTGLILQAKLDASKGALAAVGFTETRHEVWGLIDIFHENPFAGPSDTTFPYANQILDLLMSQFIVPGSCPKENPPFPFPSQALPLITAGNDTMGFAPGDELILEFDKDPDFEIGKDYWAVYCHGLFNISVSFDTRTNVSRVPEEFEARGVIIVMIADEIGAPTAESVLAGPLILFQQPASLNLL